MCNIAKMLLDNTCFGDSQSSRYANIFMHIIIVIRVIYLSWCDNIIIMIIITVIIIVANLVIITDEYH